MKVLVFPHHLEIGGSQVNAIDLATACRDRHGHDIVFFATPGPAGRLVAERGFRLIPAPRPRMHPSPSIARALHRAIVEERPDIVHAWDWPQAVDGFFGAGLVGVPMMCSEMSMAVLDIVPRHIPLTVGTEQLAAEAGATRQGLTELLEPPVDTDDNRPGAVDVREFQSRFGLGKDALNVVIVSRLVGWLKQEGIERAMRAVRALAATNSVRLVIVGEGSAEAALRALAETINREVERQVVILTGALIDPRPAYAAADVVVGMGGSALRGMAFAKPLIVVGEGGFSEIFEPATSAQFFWQGYYGVGDGDRTHDRLEAQLRELLCDENRRAALGAYGLEVVSLRYALGPTADKLDRMYRLTIEERVPKATAWLEAARLAARGALGATGISRLHHRSRATAAQTPSDART